MWQQFVKDYLTFSKRDRIAILVLMAVIIISLAVPRLIPEKKAYKLSEEDLAFVKELKNTRPAASGNDSQDYVIIEEREGRSDITYFNFDPNTIEVSDWERLGVSFKTANTIKKYLSRGGKFRVPDDLLKIYTLDKKTAARLIPYVRIKNHESSEPERPATNKNKVYSKTFLSSKKDFQVVDINVADTGLLKTLPGIGSFRAKMIVRLRDSLLGFKSTEQLRGVWFLPDSVFEQLKPYFKLGDFAFPPLNINTTTLTELSKHPLFGKSKAAAIIAYRKQHGAFTQVSDLRKVHLIDDELYEKIKEIVVVR